jgi:hypothetical protein
MQIKLNFIYISIGYIFKKKEALFRQGTIPFMRIASSGHTSSHFLQPKQTVSLMISSKPLLSLKQKTGQISTHAPQAEQ